MTRVHAGSGPVAGGVGADPPPAPDRFDAHLGHDLGIPVQMAVLSGFVGVGLLQGAAFDAAVHDELQAP